MAPKLTLYSHCRTCGERIAKVRGNFIHDNQNCSCPKPPGPACPPRRFHYSEVIFEQNGPDEDPWDVRKDELRGMIRRMKDGSAEFYRHAAQIGNHPFIEFAGLMNEYINVCQEALEQGIDFTQCSKHTGQALPMQSHHLDYLYEKLECIYGESVAAEMRKRLEEQIQKSPADYRLDIPGGGNA